MPRMVSLLYFRPAHILDVVFPINPEISAPGESGGQAYLFLGLNKIIRREKKYGVSPT